MYTRFIRWSTDRLGGRGIIAFVSNNSFLEASSYDGFRKCIVADFEEMWVINLKGNARTRGERRKKEGGNIFDNKIKVGIAIYFLIRNQTKKGPKKDFKLYYYEIDDYLQADEKKAFLAEHPLEKLKINFENIILEDKRYWFVSLENEYDSFIKLAKDSKSDDELCIFKFRKPGVSTNRDQWVYDFDEKLLTKKIKFFIKKYQATLNKKKKERKKIYRSNLLTKNMLQIFFYVLL